MKDWVETGLAVSSTRICASDLQRMLGTSTSKVTLIDVRGATEFGICHLPGSISECILG